MNRFKNLRSITALAILSIVLLTRCGAEDETQGADAVDRLIDTASAQIAEKVVEATFANDEQLASYSAENVNSKEQREAGTFSELHENFADVLVYDKKLYALFDGGVVIHDLTDRSNSVVRVDDQLEAIALHDGSIYLAGKQLYILDGPVLRQQSDDYVGAISALYSYDHRLLVGTESALYIKSVFGRELLLEDISITALAADRDGLWIGTAKSGLYRWDGTDVKRRRLLRDSTMFDNINTLDYKHNHLYVGSARGLHIFDGGRWLNLASENGLPSDNVTSIDATDWVVYVGTDAGVVSFYGNEFSPVQKLENVGVNALYRSGSKLYVATAQGEIVAKSKMLMKTIIESTQLATISSAIGSAIIVEQSEPADLIEIVEEDESAISEQLLVPTTPVLVDLMTVPEFTQPNPDQTEPTNSEIPLFESVPEADSNQKLTQIQ